MDTEGWFSMNGLKCLVKWHYSGSYQLDPGKIVNDAAGCLLVYKCANFFAIYLSVYLLSI